MTQINFILRVQQFDKYCNVYMLFAIIGVLNSRTYKIVNWCNITTKLEYIQHKFEF